MFLHNNICPAYKYDSVYDILTGHKAPSYQLIYDYYHFTFMPLFYILIHNTEDLFDNSSTPHYDDRGASNGTFCVLCNIPPHLLVP